MEDITLLKRLLNNSKSPFAEECLDLLSREEPTTVTTGPPVVGKELFDIYSKRAKRNESLGKPIRGFEEVVPSLKSREKEMLQVFVLSFRGHKFVFFSDKEQRQLV